MFFCFVLLLLFHRTLITGMVSGSIVAFNIDFNRWHYEHQNRYWGAEIRAKHTPNQNCGWAALQRIQRGWEGRGGRENIDSVTAENEQGVRPCGPRQTCCYLSLAEQSGYIFCLFFGGFLLKKNVLSDTSWCVPPKTGGTEVKWS